jgi:hypothetical protein
MKRTIGLVILLSAAALSPAQEMQRVTGSPEKMVTKVITLKNANNVSSSVLDGIGLIVKRSGDIVVVTGAPDRVDTAEAILKQLDVPLPPRPVAPPRKSIQLTAYLIVASRSEVQGTPLPKELASAVNQVASVFPYKSFNLVDAIDLRLTDNTGGYLNGIVPQGQQTFPNGGKYMLSVNRIALVDGTPDNLLRINKFDLILNDVKLSTDIDLKEGQKVVVGKANIDGSSNALIVILTAKIVD